VVTNVHLQGGTPPLTPRAPRAVRRRRHNDSNSPLLDLPDSALGIIASKMGKRARLVCIKLCQVYGPPGAVICPPAKVCTVQNGWVHNCSDAVAKLLSVTDSWAYPVGHVLASGLYLSARDCGELAAALLDLPALTCKAICRTPNGVADDNGGVVAPLTSLTRLCVLEAFADLHAVTTFAPHLRALEVRILQLPRDNGTPLGKWGPETIRLWTGAITNLRSLQHVELPLNVSGLATPAFACTLQRLTALTHLGLDMLGHVPAEGFDGLRITQALAALPLVASVKLDGAIRVLGGSLGPALQALRLRRLELIEDALGRDDEREEGEDVPSGPDPIPAGCLPKITAMRELRHMTISGRHLSGSSAELQRMCSGGSTSLQSLALHSVHPANLQLVLNVLARLPALTSLSLRLSLCRDDSLRSTHDERLECVLEQQPQLRHLEVWTDAHRFMPVLTRFSALTSFHIKVLSKWHTPFQFHASDLKPIWRLTTLRKLVLDADVDDDSRGKCLRGVRKLPLLEELELPRGDWFVESVWSLVPPPEQLKKVAVGISRKASARLRDFYQHQQMFSDDYGVELTTYYWYVR
jgi:hypothetical protein